ncbi:MAG: hypothetical protein WCK96_17690 [Methylococcales bacterium]
MIHTNKPLCLLVVVTAFLLNGCSHRVADFSIVSTKNIDLTQVAKLDPSAAKRYSGEDCSFFLLNQYPFFNKIPNLELAVDKALKKGNGNVMVDEISVESDVWVLLGNIKCIQAEGAVLNVPPKIIP